MKTLYQLTQEINELNKDLRENTMLLRTNRNNSVRLIELLHVRQEIVFSICHRQAMVIKTYENVILNVTPINTKKAS